MREKIHLGASLTILAFGVASLFYFFFARVVMVVFPFAFGWGIALLARRPAFWLHKKTRLPLGVARLLLVLAFALGLVFLLVMGARVLFSELSALLAQLGKEDMSLIDRIQAWLSHLPLLGEVITGSAVEEGLSRVFSVLPQILGWLADVLPALFFTLGVGVLAAIYFCLDLERVHEAILCALPPRVHAWLQSAKESAVRAALSVLRAQGLLMLLCFVLLLLGFVLLDVKYPLVFSALFALLDILPVIGIGLFLIPWGIGALLTGRRVLGIGLLLLFALIGIVRQFAESRLLGAEYGVHPLLTLLSLYAGAKLFGVLGMLLLPALVLLLYEVLFSRRAREKK